MNASPSPKTRNHGIDLFKIFAMFMVVAIHTVDGVVSGSPTGSLNNYVSTFMRILFFSAVNCFALSSGYILINIKYKFHKIISMYCQVWFYSVLITLIFFLLFPGTYSVGTILHSILPFTANRYWYFSAYVGLYLILPFLNHSLNLLTQKQHFTLSLVLFILFSVLPMIALNYAIYNTGMGFSFLWIVIIYIWGTYFGKYGINIKISTSLIMFIVCSCLIFASAFNFFVGDIPILSTLANMINLYRYESPATVLAAISLLSIFVKIQVTNKKAIKMIEFIIPLNFGIYLIHNNQIVKDDIILKYLPIIGKMSTLSMIFFTILTFIVIWTICIGIEWLRFHLFKFLKIELFSKKISNKLLFILNKISPCSNKQ